MRGHALIRAAWLVAAVLDCGAGSAGATTVVPMSPRALVAGSLGAVRGRVVSVDGSRDPATGTLWTQVTIDPSAQLFGTLPAGRLVLHERGGHADGSGQRVYGAPEYRVGDEVIAFVSADREGRLHTTALAMGLYRIEARGGAPRAVRRFDADVAVLDPGRGTLMSGGADEVLGADDLLGGVAIAVAQSGKSGGRRLARRSGSVPVPPRAPFVLLNPAVRWFEPDDGKPIRYLIDPTGEATIGPTASRDAVAAGLAAWSSVAEAQIDLEDGGDTDPVPLGACDATRIIFDDPFGELDPPEECEGVLAVTLVCDGDEERVVNGRTFRRIHNSMTTLNDGYAACPFWNACSIAQILTHELGHTVGLGHSQFPQAIMAARAVFDGRCSGLAVDDERGLAAIYPLRPSPSATPSKTPPPPPTPTITQTPTVTATRPTATVTRTGTNTRTPSRTQTPSFTVRPSRTVTPTWTRVPTRTATASITQTPSRTAPPTATATITVTPSITATPTPSPTASPTLSATASVTATTTATITATPSITATTTDTATPTLTPTPPPRPSDRVAALVRSIRRLLTMLAQSD